MVEMERMALCQIKVVHSAGNDDDDDNNDDDDAKDFILLSLSRTKR